MNFRHRKVVIVVQTLLGLLLLFAGVMGLIHGTDTEGVPTAMVPVLQMFWHTGILQAAKVIETVVGLMLIFCFLPALAAILFAPVAVGIVVVNAMVSPESLPLGIVVGLLTAYLGYAYWDKYRALFTK